MRKIEEGIAHYRTLLHIGANRYRHLSFPSRRRRRCIGGIVAAIINAVIEAVIHLVVIGLFRKGA
jgi:hypothetical protein